MGRDELSNIREEVKKYIDHADEKVVQMIHAMLEVDAAAGWWESLPDDIKADVETSVQQADHGTVISHEQVKAAYTKWFTK